MESPNPPSESDRIYCAQCKGIVEPERWAYAIPTCYACLPPPPPLPVLQEDGLRRHISLDGYMGSMPDTLQQIEQALVKGRTKFPGRRFLLAALTEEVGEVARALLQKAPHEKLCEECAQVAGLCIRIMEEGDGTFDDMTDAEAKP